MNRRHDKQNDSRLKDRDDYLAIYDKHQALRLWTDKMEGMQTSVHEARDDETIPKRAQRKAANVPKTNFRSWNEEAFLHSKHLSNPDGSWDMNGITTQLRLCLYLDPLTKGQISARPTIKHVNQKHK